MINFAAVGRRAPVDVSAAGIFCAFGDNFQTAAPNDDGADVQTGALVFTSIAEMTERGRPTDENIADLDGDVRAKLVFGVPAEERAEADAERKRAASYGSGPLAAVHLSIAKQLEADAATNEARAKGKPADQVDAQQRFSKSFATFKAQWDSYYQTVKNGDAFDDASGNEVASTIDGFDARYRTYLAGYGELGFKPDVPPAKKSDAGDVLAPNTPKVPGAGDALDTIASFLKWGLVAALVIGGLSLLTSARHVAT